MITKIKEHVVFDGVEPETVNKIIAAASPIKTYSKNETLFEPQTNEKDIFFILSGTVRLTLLSDEGDVVSYNDIQKKDFFGWLSILDDKERLTAAITQEECKLVQINGNIFKEVLFSDNQLMQNFMFRIATVIRSYTKRIEELSALSVKERILNEIYRRKRSEDNLTIIGTHEDFASWVGVTRETVTRSLRELETNGLIKKTRNGYEVLNKKQD